MKKLVSVVVVTKDRQQDLLRCLKSISLSTYKPVELIVVDNGSKRSEEDLVKKLYPQSKFKRSEQNIGAAAGRNLGIELAKGDYLLFVDDDAFVDKEMIAELVKILETEREVGIVQPKIYEFEKKDVLQGLGCDVNLITGMVSSKGIREKDTGQYDRIVELQSVGCIWMVKREVIERIGNYDEVYFIPWEDTDFSFRVRRAGFKILFVHKARAWHKGVKATFVNPVIDYLGIRSPERAYRIFRNKIIFMRKNAPFQNFLVFIFFVTPLYVITHSFLIAITGRFDILKQYLLGFLSGIWFVLVYQNSLVGVYRKLDGKLINFKYQMMVWTDPICYVVNKKVRTVLDVGCGMGVPMELLRRKIEVNHAVGVDLFVPYLEIAGGKRLHNEYVEADVRKMKFKPKSFDLVFASDVLEHLQKKDAWKMLADMERFAKKQVIVTTSLGYFYHPAVDGNLLQLHVSGYHPEEFVIRGYKTFVYGRKELLGTGGLVHTIKFDPLKKLIFLVNFLLFPFYIIFPGFGNYCFVAFKDMSEND